VEEEAMTNGAKRVLWTLRHHPEGISTADIARDIGISPRSVGIRIREIRDELAEAWWVDVDHVMSPIEGTNLSVRETVYVLRRRDGVDNKIAQEALPCF
jgi:hypothetical protein